MLSCTHAYASPTAHSHSTAPHTSSPPLLSGGPLLPRISPQVVEGRDGAPDPLFQRRRRRVPQQAARLGAAERALAGDDAHPLCAGWGCGGVAAGQKAVSLMRATRPPLVSPTPTSLTPPPTTPPNDKQRPPEHRKVGGELLEGPQRRAYDVLKEHRDDEDQGQGEVDGGAPLGGWGGGCFFGWIGVK